jgi:hypothetical protein
VLKNPLDPETLPSNVARSGTAEASCGTVHANAAMSRGIVFFMGELL